MMFLWFPNGFHVVFMWFVIRCSFDFHVIVQWWSWVSYDSHVLLIWCPPIRTIIPSYQNQNTLLSEKNTLLFGKKYPPIRTRIPSYWKKKYHPIRTIIASYLEKIIPCYWKNNTPNNKIIIINNNNKE